MIVIRKNIKCKIVKIKSKARLVKDERAKSVLAGMKKYCESVFKEIHDRIMTNRLRFYYLQVDVRPFNQCQVYKTKKS